MAVLPVSPAPISSPAPIMSTPAPMSTQPAQNMTPVPAPVTPRPSATIASAPTPSSAPTAPPIATVSPLTAVYDRNTADAARNVVRNEALALNLPAAPSTPSDPALVSAYMNAQARGLVPVLSFAPGQDQNTAMREALSRAGQWSPTGPTSLPQASSTSTTAYATPTSPGRSHPYTTRQRPGSDGYSFVDYNVSTITGEEVDSNGMPLRSGSSSGSGSSGSGSQGSSGTSGSQNGTNGQAGAGQSNQPMSSGEALLQQFLERQRDIGDLSVSEQNSIDAAGRAAGAAYDPIIAEAKEEKKQGMAKGLIAGGQSGGFLNSQIAGVAAFTPTQGGTFVGEGGSLYRLQDRYIGAIANLESKKLAAIQDAMVQRTKAIRTGKGEDLDRMKQAFDMAMQIDREKREVAQEGLDKLIKLQQLKKYEREDDMETFKSISEAGIDVDPEYFQDLDAKYKRPQGTYQALWDVQQDVRRDKALGDQIERQAKMTQNAERIIGIADKMGINTPVYVDGSVYTYQGKKAENVESGTQVDSTGRMTYWEFNKDNKTTKTVDMGFIGAMKDGWQRLTDDRGNPWAVNTKTKQTLPMSPSQTMQTWQTIIPEGSRTTPWRPATDPMAGQCGAVMNDCNDPSVGRIWGDTIQQKLDVVKGGNRDTGQPWEVPVDQAQEGDTLVFSVGTTGHVARVNQREIGPDGKLVYRLFESNMVPPGGRQISSTRVVRADDPSLVAAARVPTRPELNAGPDSLATSNAITPYRPTFGGQTTEQLFAQTDEWRSERLTPAEAKSLGVAYGMTRGEAADKGITPGAKPTTASLSLPSFDEWARGMERSLASDPSIMSSDPRKLREVYDRTVGAAPSYLDASFGLSLKFPGDSKGQAFLADLQSTIDKGDFPRAKDKLKKAALDTADMETGRQVRGRDSSLRALDSIERDLQEYTKKGGSLNILTGTYEDMARKIGTVSDPERRRIATKIQSAIADYRKSISGAAFTESEKKEYDAMFPSTLNTEALNLANISAMRDIFNQGNESFYRQQLGNENYEAIFGF